MAESPDTDDLSDREIDLRNGRPVQSRVRLVQLAARVFPPAEVPHKRPKTATGDEGE